ncbi:MAG: plasma-membrane proton-efflux P-type ATPase [Nitrososphaerales archaeon]
MGASLGSITPSEEKDLPVVELFKRLATNEKGLSSSEAAKRLQQYGVNEITEKKRSPIVAILGYFWGPIPGMIEAAAIISAILQNWDDLVIITALLVVNVIVRSWQENKASNEIELLKKKLALTAKMLRDGKWTDMPAKNLVPGDIVRLRLGNIIPADIKLVDGAYLQIDESALTGESLPVEKHPGDIDFSSSIIRQGEMNALVVTTGMKTFYGRTTKLVEEAKTKSHFQGAVVRIGDYLIALAAVMVTIVSIVGLFRHEGPLEILQFGLVLIVAAIPAAMPAVLSVCMTVGASALAKKEAIVSKLVAIDEMAGVDILCADKTGTITKNELTVGEVKTFNKYTANDVLLYATLASREEDKDPIDDTIIKKAKTLDGMPSSISSFKISSFKPFDPVSKRTEAAVEGKDGHGFQVTKGAPQVVLSLVHDKSVEGEVNEDVSSFAMKGYRALGVARTDGGKNWQYVGLIALSDPPREDSAATIKTAESMGITVKMVTGDHAAIAKEVCREVGLGTDIVSSSSILNKSDDEAETEIEKVDGFAEVFPEHKYKIVELLQKKGHIVCMTGDGVNDAPALKKADCGIAVAGATDAAKSAAAVVLTKPGLSVIIDAVTESRKIFQRMTNYAIYRINETFRVLFFISLSIIVFKLYPVTALMIVLLALLNDMPIMTISYDNVKISQKPEKWNMRKLLGISSFLGGMGTVSSFGMLIIGLEVLHLNPLVLQSFIYLKLSVAGHLTLFVARTKGPFWSVRPAKPLFLAVILTQLTATLITVYGILLPAMGWELAAIVWGYALASFLVQDFAKVRFYKLMDREGGKVGRDEAVNALRTVAPDKAFTFYRDYGQPLGVTSKSLEELATTLKSIEPSSVRFHVERGDFEGWFGMLGDKFLADQVAALRGKNLSPDELRKKVSSMVSKRVDQLQKIAGSKGKEAEVHSVLRSGLELDERT